MRLVHTADWHLGKLFYGDYLTDEQDYLLKEQFLPFLRDCRPDAVILAGDVYDRSLPPVDAVALFDEVVTKITKDMKLPFFVISGNHDSASRLSFGSRLLEQGGLYISGDLRHLGGPVVLSDDWGPVSFVSLPFAEPAAVRHCSQDDMIRDWDQALQYLCRQQRQQVTTARSVCIAHAFVAGGAVSDSERPLSVGGTEVVSPALFVGFSYTALGHLHGPQQVGGQMIRYAGSLLKYSFSEAGQKKGAVLAEIDKDGGVCSETIPLAPRHDVRIMTGFFDDIMGDGTAAHDDFVLLRLQDTQPILDGMAKARRKFPRALALEMPQRQLSDTAGERRLDLQQSTAQQLFESFVSAMRPQQGLTAAEKSCLQDLWQELEREEREESR